MARIPLGALTTLNTSLHLDPMFIEIYSGAFANFVFSNGNAGLGGAAANYGANARVFNVNGVTDAGLDLSIGGTRVAGVSSTNTETGVGTFGTRSLYLFSAGTEGFRMSADGVSTFSRGATKFQGWSNVSPVSVTGVHIGAPGGGSANISFTRTTGGVDDKIWDISYDTNGLAIRAINDASSAAPAAIVFGRTGAALGPLTFGGAIRPAADNALPAGSATLRWSVVYAATGAINTSDAREKTAVAPMSDAEVRAASRLAREVGSFQWLASIEEKGGDSARLHIGMTVQRAIEVLEEEGLQAARYAFICHDEWEATDALTDEEGRVLLGPTSAGDRYGFRYDQLAMFILRGQEERLRRLEERA